jgi:hypothetical protein
MALGSFGNVSPDKMAAIKEALGRRQMGDNVPALNQQSAASPSASPQPVQPSGSMSQPSGIPGGELPQTLNLTQQGNPEAKMIVGALKERLKAISTTELGPLAK